ncbi:MAG: hypothetical protein ABSG31_14540 [Tepidisphaeraceae bacterium]|jgi:hypothetical protein
MQHFSRRKIIVICSFTIWLIAAALACGPFISRPIDPPQQAEQPIPAADSAQLAGHSMASNSH